MSEPITVPQSLAELFADPSPVRDAFSLLNALAQIEVHIVPPGNGAAIGPRQQAIKGDPPSLVLPLPLKFAQPISAADSYAATASGTYSQAQVQALMTQVTSLTTQLNLLLAALRSTGQNPS